VRDSRLLLMQLPRAALDAITRLLPGAPLPTLTAVDGKPDQIVLQALCAGAVSWRQLEEMKRAGARDMLVLPVEKMLA
jgi:ATP phosphoribosyltransferase